MATKTQGMTQASTINNARMHAGKRKAGNTGTRQQQMNSVTSARTRNQKKKQINKPSHASTPIASSPASVAHSARSPSVAGLAAEDFALNEDLKKGWLALKSYLDNEASADDVHGILQCLNDPELDQAFAEIMGCEPDEHSRYNNLYKKVGKKFLELENTADVVEENSKAKTKKTTKAKTTFRPAFSGGRENPVSNSMSQAPMNHPPPPPHSTSAISTIPTPTAPIHTSRQSPITPSLYPLMPTPTAANHDSYCAMGLLVSSCPPSPPLAGHDKDSRAVVTGDIEGKGREGGWSMNAHKKSKGKQKATMSEDKLFDDTESEEAGKTKGRLLKAVKAEAFAIRQRYHDELEALAKNYAVNPNGLGLVRHENQSEAEFTADIRDCYVKLRNRESEPSDLNLDGILEWYRKEILEETAEQRAGGYTKKEIEKLCVAFINWGCHLYEARQLCSIGSLVDPVSALAVPWGADPLYVAMRDANPAQVTAQAIDYGTMFHSQLMLQKQGGLGLDPVKQGLVNRFVDDGTDKVVLRGLLKDVLLLSLQETDVIWFNWDPNVASCVVTPVDKTEFIPSDPGFAQKLTNSLQITSLLLMLREFDMCNQTVKTFPGFLLDGPEVYLPIFDTFIRRPNTLPIPQHDPVWIPPSEWIPGHRQIVRIVINEPLTPAKTDIPIVPTQVIQQPQPAQQTPLQQIRFAPDPAVIPIPPNPINTEQGWKGSRPGNPRGGNRDVEMQDTERSKTLNNPQYHFTSKVQDYADPQSMISRIGKMRIEVPLFQLLGLSPQLSKLMSENTRTKREYGITKDGITKSAESIPYIPHYDPFEARKQEHAALASVGGTLGPESTERHVYVEEGDSLLNDLVYRCSNGVAQIPMNRFFARVSPAIGITFNFAFGQRRVRDAINSSVNV
ncbi:hypothetical protein DFJ43DRAFT_1161736 [Lentinula guzmanii]|uniref:DUF4100 domain-containing protein n=1 Tax=Lentinula guzmanii TaxID=2804957 RepID=A0AA38J2I2_9AGAR|nr:hypothetical protein DFJ43DRAFT_1161736 [Lentinula guzmanii]